MAIGDLATGCSAVQQQPFYGRLSGTTRVSWYQKKHSPTHHLDHHPVFISFFRLPRSIASSLFKLRAWQSFCITSVHVLFGLPLGLEPSTLYSIHRSSDWLIHLTFKVSLSATIVYVRDVPSLWLCLVLKKTKSFSLWTFNNKKIWH